jgi:hypothetical protein
VSWRRYTPAWQPACTPDAKVLRLSTFGKRQQEPLNAINRYWGRDKSAPAYQAEKRRQQKPTDQGPA